MDHAGAVADLAVRLEVPVEGPHEEDSFWIDRLGEHGAEYGMDHCRPFVPDRWLTDGDLVTVGEQEFEVRHCPGHTPGHVVFHHGEAKLAWVGDVLFHGSIGRTDFPRGDHATLIASIRDRLWPLGDDVRFVPGHGPISTFGAERQNNPFVADRVLARQ
jgi:glyoxylase-like metal-dependent hydrolase (beta-lactamase superfamily II)